MSTPTQQQRAAIEAPIHAHIVLSSVPGSGKTYVLEHRIKYLIDHGVDPANILVVTFSRFQSEDMRLRILSTNPELADSELVTSFNGRGQITTIHAAMKRMLESYYPEKRERRVATWQERSIIEKWVEREGWTYKTADGEKPVGYESILYWINEAKAAFVPWNGLALTAFYEKHLAGGWVKNLRQVAIHYQNELDRYNVWTFADMMYEAEHAFQQDKDFREYWRAQFTHVLVDEAQDVNAQAMRIVYLLDPKSLFVVGDEDQTLYRFNGATPDINMREGFDSHFAGTRLSMTTNFRSQPTLLRRASQLIEANYDDASHQYYKSLTAREDAVEGPDLTWEWYLDPAEEANDIVSQLYSRIEDGEVKSGDVFIMGRVNAQMAEFELALLQRQIPFVNLGMSSFFSRRVSRVLLAYMRLALDDHDWEAFDVIYNVASRNMTNNRGKYIHTRYLGNEFVGRLNRENSVTEEVTTHEYAKDERGWARWRSGAGDLLDTLGQLKGYTPQHSAATLAAKIDSLILQDWIQAEYGVQNDASESAQEDRAALLAIASRFSAGDLLTYVKRLQEAASVPIEQLGEYVLLGTVYRFKGLERPIVYVVGLSERLFPHRFSLGEQPPSDGVPIISKTSVWDERNLAYVAVTRAKMECHCSGVAVWPTIKEPLVPSRFVYELGIIGEKKMQFYHTQGYGSEFFATEDEAKKSYTELIQETEYGDVKFEQVFRPVDLGDIDLTAYEWRGHIIGGAPNVFWADTSAATIAAMSTEVERISKA